MYIQITDRCNMTCEHCCFSCTTQGSDMSLKTFRAALEHGDGHIMLGGGEPTLHKDFEKMLLESIAHPYNEGVAVITNGSVKRRAMMLVNLTKSGVITSELSIDEYHDPIDEEVEESFRSIRRNNQYNSNYEPGVRNTTKNNEPIPHGRAMELLCLTEEDIERDGSECCCSEMFVKPDGKVYQCGCADSPCIGDVFNGYDSPTDGECCHSHEFKLGCMENEKHEQLLT